MLNEMSGIIITSREELARMSEEERASYLVAIVVTRHYYAAGVSHEDLQNATDFLRQRYQEEVAKIILQVFGFMIGQNQLSGSGFLLAIRDWEIVDSMIAGAKSYHPTFKTALEMVGV